MTDQFKAEVLEFIAAIEESLEQLARSTTCARCQHPHIGSQCSCDCDFQISITEQLKLNEWSSRY